MGGQGGDRGEPLLSLQRGALRAFRRAPNRPYRRCESAEDPRGAVPRGRDADRAERNQVMTIENKHRRDNNRLREFYEATGGKGVLWIDNATGQIVELQ